MPGSPQSADLLENKNHQTLFLSALTVRNQLTKNKSTSELVFFPFSSSLKEAFKSFVPNLTDFDGFPMNFLKIKVFTR